MADKEVTSSPRYLYYTDLHYIPEKDKNESWAAQCLLFSKFNNRALISSAEVKKFRDIDNGKIREEDLKEMIDPKDGNEGGKAEFFAADWKANPLYIHLSNITEANLEKIPINLNVQCTDEYSKLQQQKDNDKIIMRKAYMRFLNATNAKLGYPQLRDTEDPYKYTDRMQSAQAGKQAPAEPTNLVDNIKSLISDNEDMALYNELVYKGSFEIAVELAIQKYLQENAFPRKAEKIITDIKNHNVAVTRYYTDLTTGRPIIKHYDPDAPMVSPFSQHDGGDITSWYIEEDITFADFVRMFGKNRSKEDLQLIFERNKQKFANHGLDFDTCSNGRRDAAKIRIGYHEFMSQNYDVYSKAVIKGNAGFKKMPADWYPSKQTVKAYQSERVEKHYNVWYKHYYIPFVNTDDERMNITDYDAQAKYIFDFGKVQDQQRYGNDGILSRPSLVLWTSKKMSFAQVMDRFMPKIHLLWQQFQNDLANAMPHGLVFAEELIQMMVTTADDGAKDGKDSKLEFMKKLKQTGFGITRMNNNDGKPINDGKPFIEVKTGHIESAKERLMLIMELYNMCRQSLGIDPVGEGVAPKPRQALGGIQLALDAGTSANWYMEKGFIDICINIGNRFLCHLVEIAQSGDTKRLDEIKDLVGQANGMALEALKGIPNQKLGLSVENLNTDAAKQHLVELAQQLVTAGLLDVEVLFLMTRIDNYKYAVVLMIMKYKQKQKQMADAKELEFQRNVKLKGMDIEFKKQDYVNRANAESIVVDLAKRWDERIGLELAHIKKEAQQVLKTITGENKQDEADLKFKNSQSLENTKNILAST